MNRTTASAPSRPTGIDGRPVASLPAKGIGALSFRLLGLLALAFAALLALAPTALAAPPAQFGSEGSGAGQFEGPRGIAIDAQSGDVYVADRGNNRIDKFGPEGEFLLTWGFGVGDGVSEAAQSCTTSCFGGPGAPFEGAAAGQFNSPSGVAVDNDLLSPSHGDVYVVEPTNLRVQKFNAQGEFLLMFGGEVDKTTHANLCTKADIEGGDQCGAGVSGAGASEFVALEGNSIAVGSGGSVYVGDENRIQRFGPGGGFEAQVAIPAIGFPNALAVDSAGDFYLHSFEVSGVHKYDPAGTELGEPRDTSIGSTAGIALNPAGELFVSGEGLRVNGFDPAGNQILSFGAGLDGTSGIAFSPHNGALYVLSPHAVHVVFPPPPGPLILPGSQSAVEIGTKSANLQATLNPEGAETEYRFEYGSADCLGGGCTSTATQSLAADFEDHPVGTEIEGLSPRTTYHFRLVAINANGEATGPDQTFETLPPVSIDSTSVSKVGSTGATLAAEMNPHGLASSYRFEYGTTTAYGTSVPVPDGSLGSGNEDVLRTASVQGLAPNTTYHYRVVAENLLGTVQGPDRTFITQGFFAAGLADGRGWELVSPPNKHGSALEPINDAEGGGLIKAAALGDGLAYYASGPTSADPAGTRSPEDAQLLSHREAAGWSTQEITTPHEEISLPGTGHISEYKAFAEDLSTSVVEPLGATRLSAATTERTPYRREPGGEMVPLVSVANVLPGAEFGGKEEPLGSGNWVEGVQFLSGTPDLSHLVFDSAELLAPGFAPGFEANGRSNLYELANGTLSLISVLPSGEAAAEAGLSSFLGVRNNSMRGAISADGERVIFEAGAEGQSHLYMRDVGRGQTIQLDAPASGAAGGNENPNFQVASADGSRVFFTDPSRLTPDATSKSGKPDLYMCEIAVSAGQLSCSLSDLSLGLNPGEAADVRGWESVGGSVTIDSNGEHAVFAANGVLTNAANSRGEHAQAANCGEATGDCNLYLYEAGSDTVSLIAVLDGEDAPDWGAGGLKSLTARFSPDGQFFSFMSRRSLTGYDNRDARSGQPDQEVFLLNTDSGELRCASCNPTGARPSGILEGEGFREVLVDYPTTWRGQWLAATIPGWTALSIIPEPVYQSRYLSNTGRLFFNAADALAPQDTNGVMDVYEFEPAGVGDCTTTSSTYSPTSGGCVSLVSSGTSPEESAFLDASVSGNDVFFLTASRLVEKDTDSALDVYDARVGGGEASVLEPPQCDGDACQPPAVPPAHPTPGTSLLNGPGNVLQCPKGKVKKSGKCVKQKKGKKRKHHKKTKKQTKNRRANSNRGGVK